MSIRDAYLTPPPRLMKGLLVTVTLAVVIFLVGLFVAPQRAWGGYLIGFVYFVGLALAGGLFLSLLTLSSASWATALRRIPEAMTGTLPGAALLGLILIGGINSLYEWSHASVVAEDELLQAKSAYLNTFFFFVRLVVYFALWIWITRGMLKASRRMDVDAGVVHKKRRLIWSALFLPTFAITFSLASVDWLESLEPHWFSTIYGLVTLSGLGTSGLAVGLILAIYLRRGPMRNVIRADHLDDLGKIGIGLALFWGYIWYCQYMLIWYTDMPEETPYYALRAQGGWKTLMSVNLLLNWAIPFFALMPRAVRRSEKSLLRIAWIMLAGHALQLFVLIGPALMGPQVVFGVWELAPLVGALAGFLILTLRGLAAGSLTPTGDPGLQESLTYHS